MPDLAVVWRDLHFAVPVELEQAVGLLRQFATMSGSPRLVCEAESQGGQMSWRIGGSEAVIKQVVALLAIELPGSSVAPVLATRPQVAVAARLVISRHRERPLAIDRSEAAARGLLAALSTTRSRELVRLQVVLGERLHPTPAPYANQPLRGEAERRRLLAPVRQADVRHLW